MLIIWILFKNVVSLQRLKIFNMKKLIYVTIFAVSVLFASCGNEPAKKDTLTQIPELCDQLLFLTADEACQTLKKAGFVQDDSRCKGNEYFFTRGKAKEIGFAVSNDQVTMIAGTLADTTDIDKCLKTWDDIACLANEGFAAWTGMKMNMYERQDYKMYMDGYLMNQIKMMIAAAYQSGAFGSEEEYNEIVSMFNSDRADFVAEIENLYDVVTSGYLVPDNEVSIQGIMTSMFTTGNLPQIQGKYTSIEYSNGYEAQNISRLITYSVVYGDLAEMIDIDDYMAAPARQKLATILR